MPTMTMLTMTVMIIPLYIQIDANTDDDGDANAIISSVAVANANNAYANNLGVSDRSRIDVDDPGISKDDDNNSAASDKKEANGTGPGFGFCKNEETNGEKYDWEHIYKATTIQHFYRCYISNKRFRK